MCQMIFLPTIINNLSKMWCLPPLCWYQNCHDNQIENWRCDKPSITDIYMYQTQIYSSFGVINLSNNQRCRYSDTSFFYCNENKNRRNSSYLKDNVVYNHYTQQRHNNGLQIHQYNFLYQNISWWRYSNWIIVMNRSVTIRDMCGWNLQSTTFSCKCCFHCHYFHLW